MKQSKFFRFFSAQAKLSMRSVRTGEELWHVFISRGNFLLAALALLVVLFVGTLTVVAYTSILDLIPGYPGNRSREMLISSIAKLDSLEREVAMWENYTHDLQLILDGRASALEDTRDTTKTALKGQIVPRNAADEALRARMAPDSLGGARNDKRRTAELTFEMIAPVRGIVDQKFDPADGRYGVSLKPIPNAVALAVLDGTVVFNSWSPDVGTTVAVQHGGGMMSVYKGLARSLRRTGERIKAGQGVGVVEAVKENKIPMLQFELWSAGNAVDPENYITF